MKSHFALTNVPIYKSKKNADISTIKKTPGKYIITFQYIYIFTFGYQALFLSKYT